jgi:hypothetical protein
LTGGRKLAEQRAYESIHAPSLPPREVIDDSGSEVRTIRRLHGSTGYVPIPWVFDALA